MFGIRRVSFKMPSTTGRDNSTSHLPPPFTLDYHLHPLTCSPKVEELIESNRRKESHKYTWYQRMVPKEKNFRLGEGVKPSSCLPAQSPSTFPSTRCLHQNAPACHGTLLMETKDQNISELGRILGISPISLCKWGDQCFEVFSDMSQVSGRLRLWIRAPKARFPKLCLLSSLRSVAVPQCISEKLRGRTRRWRVEQVVVGRICGTPLHQGTSALCIRVIYLFVSV